MIIIQNRFQNICNAFSQGERGEKHGETGRGNRPPLESCRTSAFLSGREKHSRRPPKMFTATAEIIHSGRREPVL